MRQKLLALALIAFLSLPASAYAVGSNAFENASFSAASLAQSNAVVAQAEEAAAISYNPAGITQLKGFQTQGSNNFIGVSTFYSGANGDTTQSGGTLTYVPTAYATINPGRLFNDRLVLGIGSDSPFGLANKYESVHPIAHYVGYHNAIKMFTIKPVAAFKLHEKLSIGAGPVFYKIFDFRTTLAYPNQLLIAGLPDGIARADLYGKGWGWQAGLLAKPHKQHQFGFYFRSPVHMQLRGNIKVEGAGGGVGALGPEIFERGAGAKLALPLNMTWAYAYKPTDKWTLEADFGYTRWSIHRRLYVNFDSVNPATHDLVLNALTKQDKDYQDGYSINLGTNYKVNPKWTLMAGSYFYWASVPQDHWNVTIPDSNRLAFTLGTGYEITNWLKLDLSYLAGFNLRRKIDNGTLDALGQTMDGRYSSYVHGIYTTLTYKWEDIFDKNAGSHSKEKEAAMESAILVPPASEE